MPFLTLKVTVIALLFLLYFLVFSILILILWIYFFFFFLSGKICDGSNGDVAVDQYHRYPVRLFRFRDDRIHFCLLADAILDYRKYGRKDDENKKEA